MFFDLVGEKARCQRGAPLRFNVVTPALGMQALIHSPVCESGCMMRSRHWKAGIRRKDRSGRLCTALFSVAFVTGIAGPALSDGDTDKARQMREASQARSAAKIGYPYVYDPTTGVARDVDYLALSATIRRLAAMIEELERAGPLPAPARIAVPVLPGRALSADELSQVYGPDGPNARSVRLLLEYHLMVGGNPRLKVGDVREEEKAIIATVATRDGSLVEEYRVDKANGQWQAVRPK